ncbi:response regulator transcription factor [Flavobacterium lindanitolerans]|uniref:response regulator transcription factor n=1 Tax=Flavobacterium lindanitolerans TaxID=428988 RepID=UPI0031DF26E7
MENKKLNIAILDDHPLIIEGLTTLFSNHTEFNLLGGFNQSEELYGFEAIDKIDVLLLDIFFGNNNGIDICFDLKKKYPKMIILGISSQAERSIVLQMIKQGASGYLLKTAKNDEYIHCIKEAAKGKIVFGKKVQAMLDKIQIADLKSIPRLTKREKEILALLIKGKSTQEISEELFLSFLTIQTHRRNLLQKFDVKNSLELINFANENGLLNDPYFPPNFS